MITFRPRSTPQNQHDLQAIYQNYRKDYPDILDCSQIEDDEILSYMEMKVLMAVNDNLLANPPKESTPRKRLLYGGITNNIPTNLSRHRIDRYVACVFVDSYATAMRIEERLCSELDLCIGEGEESSAGRGGKNEGDDDDSRIVYIADMTIPGFER